MNRSTIAVLMGLAMTVPALAQRSGSSATDHDAHHPPSVQGQGQSGATAQSQAAPGGSAMQGQMPMSGGAMMGQRGQGQSGGMGGMMGQRGSSQGTGMMGGMMGSSGCPMMQGGMMGMQMGAQSRGDQSVGTLALQAVNQRMHREMMFEYTGEVDADFTRNMIAHHQGAVDMAKIVAAFGKDPKIRQLAESIIKAQEDEIATMKAWLAENAPKQ